jgi:hypothetical protein
MVDPYSRSEQPLILGPSSTDAAWDEVPQDPPGWFGPAVERRWPDRWRAWYRRHDGSNETLDAFEDSEAAALRALASELRAHPGSIPERIRIE